MYVCRSSDEFTLVGQTPTINATGDWLIVLQYVDQAIVNTTQYFVYRQNPDITDIYPLSHLLRYAYVTTSISHRHLCQLHTR